MQVDDGEEMPEAGPSMPAGYDAWKLATPPHLEERNREPPSWLELMPVGSCGRVNWSQCLMPAGHHLVGVPCTLGRLP
jgi:hypothetical protein